MSAELEWVDAPPRRWAPRRKPIVTPEQEAELRANPGRWAKVATFPGPSSAHQARKRWKDGPGHLLVSEWEVEARKFGDGSSAVFMRFVGATVEAQVEERVPDQGLGGDGSAELGGPALRSPQEPALEPEPAPHKWERFSAETEAPIVEEAEEAAAELEPPAVDVDEDEDEAGYQEQVGVIDGVCGPCRRLRCFLCVLPDCECDRPGHSENKRRSA